MALIENNCEILQTKPLSRCIHPEEHVESLIDAKTESPYHVDEYFLNCHCSLCGCNWTEEI